MKIELLKTTKVSEKGSKEKKLTHAGTVIDVSDADAKVLIKNSLAVDPSKKVTKQDESKEVISLKEEIETLKAELVAKDEEIETLKESQSSEDLLGKTK